ncbi:MAG: ABC transporter permease, partial [Lachnospiraceae bacterium]|nr:ABC transporter permease [Lachnospiraceae bacterium]
ALFIIVVFQVPVTWNVLYNIPFRFIIFIFTFWCSAFLLHFGVFVEDLANVISIVLRLVFYLTGIFYSVESRIPAPYGEWLTRYNPLAFLITGMRKSLLYGEMPNTGFLLFWLIVSLLLTIAGIRTIYRNENSYIKVI